MQTAVSIPYYIAVSNFLLLQSHPPNILLKTLYSLLNAQDSAPYVTMSLTDVLLNFMFSAMSND